MIQRIQTVYLFLVVVFTLLFLFLPIGALDFAGTIHQIKTWGIFPQPETDTLDYNTLLGTVSLISAFVVILLSVFTTLQYKNRQKQIKLGKLNILLNVLLVVAVFFYLDSIRAGFNQVFSYGIGVLFPLLSIILILMANRAIKKDDDLVRSADRLR